MVAAAEDAINRVPKKQHPVYSSMTIEMQPANPSLQLPIRIESVDIRSPRRMGKGYAGRAAVHPDPTIRPAAA
jgi:hypothetical protein